MQSSRATGSMARGQHFNVLSQLLTRSCSQWLWQRIFGVIHGFPSGYSFCLTTNPLWRFLSLEHRRTPTLWSYWYCYLSLLAVRYSFSFTSSPVQGKANPIADAFPVLTCSASGSWLLMQTQLQPWSPLHSWRIFR